MRVKYNWLPFSAHLNNDVGRFLIHEKTLNYFARGRVLWNEWGRMTCYGELS